MQKKDASGLQVIKKEDKERRVSAFLKAHLERRKLSGARDTQEFLLVARSSESPVCRAVSAMAPALADAGISLRIVLTSADSGVFHSETSASATLLETSGLRVLTDTRLYEAHEQLVLDCETCWIGDCMRREPAKCDAYENYSNASAETAKAAAATFEHLWKMSTPTAPVTRMMPAVGFKDSQEASVFSRTLPGQGKAAPTVLTRH